MNVMRIRTWNATAVRSPSAEIVLEIVLMCGRTRQAAAPAYMVGRAQADAHVPAGQPWRNAEAYAPTENVCPGRHVAVVCCATTSEAAPSLCTMRWGLVPPRAAPDHWKMFNARSETLDRLAVFRRLLAAKRCAVLIDGFFEWTDDELKGAKKQPYYVHRRSGPLWLAGLYDADDGLETFTLITRDVDPTLAWLHDRQPVALDADGLAAWLGAAGPGEAPPLGALRQRVPEAELAWHPTSKRMSKLEYQAADCASAVVLESQRQRSVASFFSPGKAGAKAEPEAEPEAAVEAVAAEKAAAVAKGRAQVEAAAAPGAAPGRGGRGPPAGAPSPASREAGASGSARGVKRESTPPARGLDGWLARDGAPGSDPAAPPAKREAGARWAAQLAQLAAMGFGDEPASRSALDATDGDVAAAVGVLLA